jgi:hypothetical protein
LRARGCGSGILRRAAAGGGDGRRSGLSDETGEENTAAYAAGTSTPVVGPLSYFTREEGNPSFCVRRIKASKEEHKCNILILLQTKIMKTCRIFKQNYCKTEKTNCENIKMKM